MKILLLQTTPPSLFSDCAVPLPNLHPVLRTNWGSLGIFIPNQSQLHTPEEQVLRKRDLRCYNMKVETLDLIFSSSPCLDHVRCNETCHLTHLSPLGFYIFPCVLKCSM